MSILFYDGSVTVNPQNTPTPGCALQAIPIWGDQTEIVIIDQTLDSLALTSGDLVVTDSIVDGIAKLWSASDLSYSPIHINSGSPSTTQLTAFQNGIILEATAKIAVLPASNDINVIPGKEYIFYLFAGVLNTATIGVTSGDFLNNTVNSTFTLAGLVGWAKAIAISDGSGWYVA